MRKTEIVSDGRVVWVNDNTGACIGRFSKSGIDVHPDAETQVVQGKQCLDCKIGPADIEGWRQFQTSMMRCHGVFVDDQHMPDFLMV